MMMMNRVQTTYKSRRISMILEKEDGEREKNGRHDRKYVLRRKDRDEYRTNVNDERTALYIAALSLSITPHTPLSSHTNTPTMITDDSNLLAPCKRLRIWIRQWIRFE